jgi:methionine-rich copper-binding protein CopC
MVRRTTMLLVAVVAFLVVAAPVRQVSAHAEPVRADPPINGTVNAAPAIVEIWFGEEATTDGTAISVFAADCTQVDLGDSAIDLNDPEHKHASVTLKPDLPDGTYTVQWQSVSAEDGDEASGSYTFTVSSTATPMASPSASAAASPAASPTACPSASPEATPAAAVGQVNEPSPFDGRALAISVGVGIFAALFIYGFWVLVRPKKAHRLA